MIVDGKELAAQLLASVRSKVAGGRRPGVVRAVCVAPTYATISYLRIKEKQATEAGMHLEVRYLPDDATTEDVIQVVTAPGCDACIVQLPLPASIDTKQVLDAIPPQKDADVLSQAARDAFSRGDTGALLPPVVGAVAVILKEAGVDPSNKRAVVLGKGWLVGEPVATWLALSGAQVEVVTAESGALQTALKDADMVIAGAGVAHLIHPEMLKEGVVLIDAGTSESGGTLSGDADPACAEVASVFTPVPGGVGPVAVAYLFKNVYELLSRNGRA